MVGDFVSVVVSGADGVVAGFGQKGKGVAKT